MTIRLSEVSVSFDAHLALSNINLELNAPTVAVIGANGSGKSTFARLLNGLTSPTKGTVTVFGNKPNTKETSFIFSNPDLQIVMPTVYEDVAYSLQDQKLTKTEIASKVGAALAELGIEGLANQTCQSLSSGQKQLLALAGAYVRKPRLLVADEPTTLLDLPNTNRISKVLKNFGAEQLVVVTHDLELANSFQEVIWFDSGQVRLQGEASKVIKAYRKFYQ